MSKPDKVISHEEACKIKEALHNCIIAINNPSAIVAPHGWIISDLAKEEARESIKILEDCENANR